MITSFCVLLESIVVVAMVAGWVAAWLHWCFRGEVRHWIVSSLPTAWRGGLERSEILQMTHDELTVAISASNSFPPFVRGVLTCPGCMSAHIAGVGVVFALPLLWDSVTLIPLIWACGAWAGHRLYNGSKL